MTTDGRRLSPQLAAVITQLAADCGVDLSQEGASLFVEMPTRSEQWLITHLDGQRISVTHCLVEEGACLAPDLDMVFALHAQGWEPIELLHTDTVWDTYVQAAKASGILVYDEQGDTLFAHFTEYWAQQLQQQGWLEHGRKVEEARVTLAGESFGRLAGCQSTNHFYCYGELWQCAGCGKTVCYAEGSDNHPELCDDCWVKHDAAQKEVDDVPF